MNTKMRRRAPGLLLAGLLGAAAAFAGEGVRNHFDTDTAGRPPGFFDLVVLGAPGPARWLILTDLNPPSAPNKLTQVNQGRPADSIAAAIRRSYVLQDGTVSTFVKRGSGLEGLILRMADEKNFLVLLVDPGSGDAVLSAYRDGKPTELGRGRAKMERGWEKFSVVAAGPALTVLFNDEKLFEAKDPKPATGKTGLAAAGPGEASFDEFVIESADPPKS
jgi:hypothetical protein